MKDKFKYVTLDRIKKENAHYNILIGQRSNGKTYAVLKEIVDNYIDNGNQGAIVRRWREDFRGKRGEAMFKSLVSSGYIKERTKGEYDNIDYYAGRWYLSKWDDKIQKSVKAPEPLAYGFALSEMEHDKSTSYEHITIILFDEFISRNGYLTDEFVLFSNVLSTIIRQRNNVKIYMCGNTVNKYCPYFKEMGLKGVEAFQEGDLKVFRYGDSELRVAVQFTDSISKKGKPSDVYFAFDNPKLQMITGKGQVWELDIYPHCPRKYFKDDIIFSYFIEFNGELLQCDIVTYNDETFTFIHRKTGKIKRPEDDLLFTLDDSPRYNIRKYINRPIDNLGKKIYYFYTSYKVFYQDNDIGELVRNYLMTGR
jgi:hypothetical protein